MIKRIMRILLMSVFLYAVVLFSSGIPLFQLAFGGNAFAEGTGPVSGGYAYSGGALAGNGIIPGMSQSIGKAISPNNPAAISISVQSYGAVGDGVTNDRKAIQNAINYAGKNGYNVLFEAGKTYKVSASANFQDVLAVNSSNITINLNGSTVMLEANSYTHYNVFGITQQTGVKIMNGALRGDRLTHNYTAVSSSHEWGYGVFIYGSEVTLENMEIYDMTGDAVCTKEVLLGKKGYTTGTAKLINCQLHHCRRQGLSVLDFGYVYVTGCSIHHIGTYDGIKGTSPMSGIDLEPASGTETIKYFELNNTRITDVGNFGIGGNASTLKAKITNLYADSPCAIDFTTCYIYDSTFDYKNENIWYMVLNATSIYNSKLISSVENKIIYIGGIWINCHIKGASKVLGKSNRLSGDYTLIGCEIEDIYGVSAQGKTDNLVSGRKVPRLLKDSPLSSLLLLVENKLIPKGSSTNAAMEKYRVFTRAAWPSLER